MVCVACQEWMEPLVDKQAQKVQCPLCGYAEVRRFLPLFLLTGASGTGKTAVVPQLQQRLPNWHVFDTDILWDSGGDWDTAHCNWLRIADALAQHPHGMPTVLCGTMLPEKIAHCDCYNLFSTVYWLALVCAPEEHARRLLARPLWRGWTEEKIAEHVAFNQWFQDHATTAFDPPLVVFDTTSVSVEQTAHNISMWAINHWNERS